jgi:molecular chaperone DnaK (HSP70)
MVIVSRLQHQHVFKSNAPSKIVIGIELGRSYSRVGSLINNSVEIFSDEQGRSAVPNYVTFLNYDDPLVGFEAKKGHEQT